MFFQKLLVVKPIKLQTFKNQRCDSPPGCYKADPIPIFELLQKTTQNPSLTRPARNIYSRLTDSLNRHLRQQRLLRTSQQQKSELGLSRTINLVKRKSVSKKPSEHKLRDYKMRQTTKVNQVRPMLQLQNQVELRVKAYSYIVMEPRTLRPYVSLRPQVQLEVASLTKIMTCYTVLSIVAKYSLNMGKEKHLVSVAAESMPGTSAEIQSGQIYSVEDLIYGMMLPSGNDAAVALAQWGGRVILRQEQSSDDLCLPQGDCINAFIARMNSLSQEVGLLHTRWANPHGLPDKKNKSCSYDVAKLCCKALQNPFFRKVVSSRLYKTRIINLESVEYQIQWQNTNRLLNYPGFCGIKTGVTATAGACMASAFEYRNKNFIVILLNTKSTNRRFSETRTLLKCLVKELADTALLKQESSLLQKVLRVLRDEEDCSEQQEGSQF